MPPLLYAADGVSALVESDSHEEQYADLLLVCFGALSGIAHVKGQTMQVPGQAQERFQQQVATRIVSLLGKDVVEQHFGIVLDVERVGE